MCMKCGRSALGYIAAAEGSKTYLCVEHLFPPDITVLLEQQQISSNQSKILKSADSQPE